MTNKEFGRVGDVPIIGAGTYAENGVGGGYPQQVTENILFEMLRHTILLHK